MAEVVNETEDLALPAASALALGRQLAFGRAAKRLGLHPPLAVLEGEADAHLCA